MGKTHMVKAHTRVLKNGKRIRIKAHRAKNRSGKRSKKSSRNRKLGYLSNKFRRYGGSMKVGSIGSKRNAATSEIRGGGSALPAFVDPNAYAGSSGMGDWKPL